MERPLIIYHGPVCSDGFCAAWVAYQFFTDAEYFPAGYGDDVPTNVDGRDVFILDFSYDKKTLLEIASKAKSVTVLDHHKTAEKELGKLTHIELATNKICLTFNMDKSGAMLAWDEFFAGLEPPWIVKYVQDRDLWKWELPHSKEISATIESLPKDFSVWNQIYELGKSELGFGRLVDDGVSILRYKDQLISNIMHNVREIEIAGYKVLSVNTPVLQSEIAGKLAEGKPFGVAWYTTADGATCYSLRSNKDGIDVSEVAANYGGGGHRMASGFSSI